MSELVDVRVHIDSGGRMPFASQRHATISFRAQDRNMTNGDYVFFTFTSLYSATPTERPWVVYNIENEDVERRLKLFYAVKQV